MKSLKPVFGEKYERAQSEANGRERSPNPYLAGQDDAADLLAEDLKPPTFLVEGFLHSGLGGEGGTVAFLAGNPGIGKTWAALQLLVAVGQGVPWFDLRTEPSPAGGIFLETPRWALQERVRSICATDRTPKGWIPKGSVFLLTAGDLEASSIDVCEEREKTPWEFKSLPRHHACGMSNPQQAQPLPTSGVHRDLAG